MNDEDQGSGRQSYLRAVLGAGPADYVFEYAGAFVIERTELPLSAACGTIPDQE